MGAVSALKAAVSTVRDNPILVGVAFVVGLLQFVLQLIPLLGSLATVFLRPFVVAGVLGMANRAFDEGTALGDFTESGTSNYASLLGAFLLLVGGTFVASFLLTGLLVVFGVVSMGAGLHGNGGLAAGLGLSVALVLVAVLVVVLVAGMVVQFINVAIVVGGASATGSFKQSYLVFRENPTSVVGYTLLQFVLLGFTLGIPTAFAFASASRHSVALTLASIVVGAVFVGLGLGVSRTYQTTYYRERAAASPTIRLPVAE